MKPLTQIAAAIFLIFNICTMAIAQATQHDLPSLQKLYQWECDKIENKYACIKVQTPIDYTNAIRNLERTMAHKHDLEGMAATTTELMRFRRAQTITDDAIVASPSELKALQETFKTQILGQESAKQKEIAKLATHYINNLEQLKTVLNQNAQKNSASLVDMEITKIKSSVDLSLAIEPAPQLSQDVASPQPKQDAPAKIETIAAPQVAANNAVTNGLSLATNWNPAMQGGSTFTAEVGSLLAANGTPNVDLGPHPEIIIYNDMHYLTPLNEILKNLNIRVTNKEPVNCPGFPKDSFFFHLIPGNYEDSCNKLILVTDRKERLVAVQLLNESPKSTLLTEHTTKWSLYNFVQTRNKANPNWRIKHESSITDNLIIMRSELVDEGRSHQNHCREYVKLFIPKPIVDVIAWRINNSGKSPTTVKE